MGRDRIRTYMLAVVAGVFVLLILGITWIGIVPEFMPGEIGGSNPTVTVLTKVTVRNDLLFDPYIKDITNTILAGGATISSDLVKSLWFEDEVVVKLPVYGPDGSTITTSKTLKVGEMSDAQASFTWKTRQRGTHTVIATLYTKDGKQLDEKTSSVNV